MKSKLKVGIMGTVGAVVLMHVQFARADVGKEKQRDQRALSDSCLIPGNFVEYSELGGKVLTFSLNGHSEVELVECDPVESARGVFAVTRGRARIPGLSMQSQHGEWLAIFESNPATNVRHVIGRQGQLCFGGFINDCHLNLIRGDSRDGDSVEFTWNGRRQRIVRTGRLEWLDPPVLRHVF